MLLVIGVIVFGRDIEPFFDSFFFLFQISDQVAEAILYLDAGCLEAFQFVGAFPLLLELGVRAVCSLENMSPLDIVSMLFDSSITLVCWLLRGLYAAGTRCGNSVLQLKIVGCSQLSVEHSHEYYYQNKNILLNIFSLISYILQTFMNSCTNMHQWVR